MAIGKLLSGRHGNTPDFSVIYKMNAEQRNSTCNKDFVSLQSGMATANINTRRYGPMWSSLAICYFKIPRTYI